MKKRNITLWVSTFLGCLFSVQLLAQTNVNMPYNTGVQVTFNTAAFPSCTAYNFFDNGGSAGAYSPNSSCTASIITFAPANPANKVQATFTAFQTEANWDALYIHDGPTNGSPLIVGNAGNPIGSTCGAGGWWGTVLPNNVGAGIVRATAGNPSGALTFTFRSDASVQQAGWTAFVQSFVAAGACAMTAAPNQSVSTGTVDCSATITTAVPSFSPAGCFQSGGFTLRYKVNGGTAIPVPAPLPATVTIPGLPRGTNIILWEMLDGCGFGVTATATQTITVADLTPPVITCPANVTLNLPPGECSTFYSYTVGLTDNCPFVTAATPTQHPASFLNHGSGTVFSLQGNTAPGGVYYNLTNGGTTQLTITGFGIRFGNPAFGAVNAPQTMQVYSKGGTYAGFETNPGAWTNKGPYVITAIPPYFATGTGPLAQLQLSSPVDVPAGGTAAFHVFGASACPIFNYFNQTGPQTSGPWTMQGGPISFGLFGPLFQAGAMSAPNIQVNYLQVISAVPVQTAGLPSGSEFPIGVTQNCFIGTDVVGNTATCCFTVTVNEYPNAIKSLVCNDLVQVSVDENCQAVIGADQVLEGGPYGCYDNYIVELDKTVPFGNGPWLPAVVGPADIGKTYQVRVTDPSTGNKCWGNLKVEDKLPPVLDCPAALIYCNSDPTPCAAPPVTLLDETQLPASFVNHGSGTAFSLSGNTQPGGVYFDLTNNDPAIAYTVAGFGIRFGNPQFGQVNPPQTMQLYTRNNTYVGFETNQAAWTNVGPYTITNIPPYFATGTGPLAIANLSTKVTIPAGQKRAFHIFGATACPIFHYFNNTGPQTNDQWTMQGGPVSFGLFGPLFQAGAMSAPNISVVWEFVGEPACLPNDLQLNVNAFPNGANCYTVNAGAGTPVLEPCSQANLCYVDTEVSQDCASGLTKRINRKWTATDASGNSATCIQVIDLIRPTMEDVVLPPSYDDIDAPALVCAGPYPTPDWLEGVGLQGYPYVFGEPDGCSIGWTYDDARIDVCDGTYKIRRKWTIIDWCTGEDIEVNQIIKVLDNVGPSITCPANITVGTDPFTCCATVNLPDVIVTDNCSRLKSISAMVMTFDPQTNQQTGMYNVSGNFSDFPGNNHWDRDTLAVVGSTPCLPQGNHTVVYTLEDNCGNTSTCSFRVTVRDFTPPVAACDEFTIVSIGVDDPADCYLPGADGCTFAGVTWVKAKTFDDGSYDNCGDIKFTIRRMAPYSDCILALNPIRGFPDCSSPFPTFPSEFERAISEYDSIKFYCCEVGTTQTVILRVYQLDANGNITVGQDGTPVFNECMIQVEVQDKIKPICQSPANVTVSCENFDPSLWAYGKASVYDNCCLDTAQVYQGQCGLTHTANYSLFDTLCSKGTITRTFRAFDCYGQSSQCTQRIFVNYEQDYWLRFPNDVIVTVCDGTGNYGEPTFNGKDCELLGVSFEDEVFTVVPDACYKIERTWTVINWCTYNPNAGCVIVPNPNPNATVNHPSNLPGPTVSPCGTPAPWNPTVVAIAPGQPPTNFCTFWDANANCYKYKQIIKVIDTQAPTVQCPASPVEVCDLTPNDPLFWNQMYWWDNTTQSHDLCEAPVDLCITGTDLCSGANVDIRYILFLDLDGDGVMETVVSSTNLPGFNNVQFGNASNPNFSGGTSRAFDNRPVPSNQKYGFALQTTTSGTNKTGCLRWNTQQSPNTYVVPQLPYGTHKIKWVVADGCGNEKVCEYTFVVKDCKKPTVVCINGLSVNIMPTKMITLWDTDFLKYTEDNCTPSNLLKTAIRKSGTGTGFPTNPDGTPQKQVTFDCNELGTQLVELWSIDLAGNADYCETYVIVQDNMGACSTNSGSVAGTLKTESNNGLEEANIALDGTHPSLPPVSMFTNSNQVGAYDFAGVPFLGNYTVTPTKDNDPLNGVSTFDLVLINKHILGLEPLNTPYKMIAADANNSRSITTFDIVELRKLILGIYTELPNNTSWRFVDKAYSFPTPSNPFVQIFPETKQIADMQASMADENFVSVKVGDVNGNAITSSLMSSDDRTAGTLLFDVEDRTVKAGEVFTVNFKAADKVQGYQFTMNYNNLEVVDIVPGANMKVENFAVFAKDGALTTSWDGSNQAEFGLTFRAKADGQLSKMLGVSSRITRAEAYNTDADRLSVAFRFNGATGSTIAGLGFELYQNTPNPFVNKTQIGFYLPTATEATLTIFDESGRMIFTQRGDYAKGYNAVTIDRAVLNTTGVLYYQLETADNSATRKMIQSK